MSAFHCRVQSKGAVLSKSAIVRAQSLPNANTPWPLRGPERILSCLRQHTRPGPRKVNFSYELGARKIILLISCKIGKPKRTDILGNLYTNCEKMLQAGM